MVLLWGWWAILGGVGGDDCYLAADAYDAFHAYTRAHGVLTGGRRAVRLVVHKEVCRADIDSAIARMRGFSMAIKRQPMPPAPTLTRRRVGQLVVVHIFVIAAANYAVQFSGSIMNYHFTYGMFIFPLAILATDLTVRLANQHQARAIVTRAYIPAIFSSAWLADWRIGLASGTAYLLGQWLDIAVFQRVRVHLRAWWVAPPLIHRRR